MDLVSRDEVLGALFFVVVGNKDITIQELREGLELIRKRIMGLPSYDDKAEFKAELMRFILEDEVRE